MEEIIIRRWDLTLPWCGEAMMTDRQTDVFSVV